MELTADLWFLGLSQGHFRGLISRKVLIFGHFVGISYSSTFLSSTSCENFRAVTAIFTEYRAREILTFSFFHFLAFPTFAKISAINVSLWYY